MGYVFSQYNSIIITIACVMYPLLCTFSVPSYNHIEQTGHQSGMVANPARGQPHTENAGEGNEFSLSSQFAPENFVSRDRLLGRPVPRQPSNTYSRALLLPPTFRDGVHLYRQSRSGRSRIYQVTQIMRIVGGVHRRESSGTGPVVLKVVPVTGAAFFQVLYL